MQDKTFRENDLSRRLLEALLDRLGAELPAATCERIRTGLQERLEVLADALSVAERFAAAFGAGKDSGTCCGAKENPAGNRDATQGPSGVSNVAGKDATEAFGPEKDSDTDCGAKENPSGTHSTTGESAEVQHAGERDATGAGTEDHATEAQPAKDSLPASPGTGSDACATHSGEGDSGEVYGWNGLDTASLMKGLLAWFALTTDENASVAPAPDAGTTSPEGPFHAGIGYTECAREKEQINPSAPEELAKKQPVEPACPADKISRNENNGSEASQTENGSVGPHHAASGLLVAALAKLVEQSFCQPAGRVEKGTVSCLADWIRSTSRMGEEAFHGFSGERALASDTRTGKENPSATSRAGDRAAGPREADAAPAANAVFEKLVGWLLGGLAGTGAKDASTSRAGARNGTVAKDASTFRAGTRTETCRAGYNASGSENKTAGTGTEGDGFIDPSGAEDSNAQGYDTHGILATATCEMLLGQLLGRLAGTVANDTSTSQAGTWTQTCRAGNSTPAVHAGKENRTTEAGTGKETPSTTCNTEYAPTGPGKAEATPATTAFEKLAEPFTRLAGEAASQPAPAGAAGTASDTSGAHPHPVPILLEKLAEEVRFRLDETGSITATATSSAAQAPGFQPGNDQAKRYSCGDSVTSSFRRKKEYAAAPCPADNAAGLSSTENGALGPSDAGVAPGFRQDTGDLASLPDRFLLLQTLKNLMQ